MGIILSIAVLLQELSEIKTSVLVPVHAHGRVHMRSRSVAGWDVDEHELVKVRDQGSHDILVPHCLARRKGLLAPKLLSHG